MIVRVVSGNHLTGHEFIGEFETVHELPVKGDTFWYGKHGPYTVIERAFVYKKDPDQASAADAILSVELVSKHLDFAPRNLG